MDITSSEEVWVIDIADNIDYVDVFIGDNVEEEKRTDDVYQISVVGINHTTGAEHIILQNAVITQTGQYIKEAFDLSENHIDQLEIKKTRYDADSNAGETVQVVLQEYLK